MRKIDDPVDDELIEVPEERRAEGLSDDDFGIFEDDDIAPSDRRRDPLRKQAGFLRADD